MGFSAQREISESNDENMVTLVTCYNKACSTKGKFDENENGPEACRYHPGGPVFHDALKGWSCCEKRVTDFSEFLNLPGCTAGYHSKDKPTEQVKPEVKSTKTERADFQEDRDVTKYGEMKVISAPPQRAQLKKKETNAKEVIVVMKPKIMSSLKTELAKMAAQEEQKATRGSLEVGWKCCRSGCSAEYAGPESSAEFCHYHPGAPIFHEGMKFWSCCERKTSDFTSFLNQVGCEKADSHSWVHPDEATDKSKQTARYDYHQTPDKIYCNVYCKGIIPKNTKVVISSKRVDINVCFGSAETEMSLRVTELWANVDTAASKLTFSGTKLELAMSKESKVQWKTLEAKEAEARVLFGQPSKMDSIWPEDIREALPEELQEKLTVKPKLVPKQEVQRVDLEPDLDIDDLIEAEWS